MLVKKSIKWFVFVILVLCLFIFSIKIILVNLPSWIACSGDTQKKVECIVTFAGETAREVYAKSLIDSGYADYWIVSKRGSKVADSLIKLVDTNKIINIGLSDNTHDEVDSLFKWLNNNKNISSIAIVSGFYHIRRIKILINKKLNNSELKNKYKFVYWGVPPKNYGFSKEQEISWWKNSHLRYLYWIEIKKMIYYYYRY